MMQACCVRPKTRHRDHTDQATCHLMRTTYLMMKMKRKWAITEAFYNARCICACTCGWCVTQGIAAVSMHICTYMYIYIYNIDIMYIYSLDISKASCWKQYTLTVKIRVVGNRNFHVTRCNRDCDRDLVWCDRDCDLVWRDHDLVVPSSNKKWFLQCTAESVLRWKKKALDMQADLV